MKKLIAAIAAMGMMLVAIPAAQAATPDGWYITAMAMSNTGSPNTSAADQAAKTLNSSGMTATVSTSKSSSSANVAIGYQFSPYVSAKIGTLGSVSSTATLNATGSGFSGTQSLKESASGWQFAVAGQLPLGGRFTPYVEVGFAQLSVTGHWYSHDSLGITSSSAASDNEMDPVLTAGLDINVTKNVAVRLQYTKVSGVGRDLNKTGKMDVDEMGAGLKISF